MLAYCSSKTYRVGDVGPVGGEIFITPSTVGNLTGLYFEEALEPSKVKRTWATGGNQELSVPGARGKAIGDGAANTAAIARQVGNVAESSAAVYASEYSVNGFSDWFLPSTDELNKLNERRLQRDLFPSGRYWSSSEGAYSLAWFQTFDFGIQDYGPKGDAYFVRPVRAFP